MSDPTPSPVPYPFRNLVFEGGGVKGIAYLGALEELRARGILDRIERVGGTSAGAINATLLALGYTVDEIGEIIWDLDFRTLLDDSWGVIRDTKRLLEKFGWYKGDFFLQWVRDRIAYRTGNPDITFAEWPAFSDRGTFRELYLIGANLSTGYAEIFSAEHTPEMRVAEAVRISMSLPFFFTSIRSGSGSLYVDGGLLNNYPVKLFDRRYYSRPGHYRDTPYYRHDNRRLGSRRMRYVYNQETLGFRLDSKREIARFHGSPEESAEEIDDFFDYTKALLRTLMNVQNDAHLHSDDWHRTVYIDTLGVGTTDFDLPTPAKRALIRSGRDHTRRYFEWWDDLANPAHNRPAHRAE